MRVRRFILLGPVILSLHDERKSVRPPIAEPKKNANESRFYLDLIYLRLNARHGETSDPSFKENSFTRSGRYRMGKAKSCLLCPGYSS